MIRFSKVIIFSHILIIRYQQYYVVVVVELLLMVPRISIRLRVIINEATPMNSAMQELKVAIWSLFPSMDNRSNMYENFSRATSGNVWTSVIEPAPTTKPAMRE